MRIIRCKSMDSLEKLENKLLKMHKKVGIMHKKVLSEKKGLIRPDNFSKVDVLLILDENKSF